MTGQQEARDFLRAVAGYTEAPGQEVPSQDRPVKLATVDALYAGVGSPKVLFDGETLMGLKTYPWLGVQPVAGDRVLMLPQGRGYVIAGKIGGQASTSTPVGTSIEGYWVAAPSGYLLEDGGVLARASYADLFAVIGTSHNTGGESGAQFRLPDSRGRATVARLAGGSFATLGGKLGAETVTLGVGEMPAHNHALNDPGHNHTQNSHTHVQDAHTHTQSSHVHAQVVGASSGGPGSRSDYNADGSPSPFPQGLNTGGTIATNQNTTAVNQAATATNNAALTGASNTATGGGGAHNNVQPSIVLNRAIRF